METVQFNSGSVNVAAASETTLVTIPPIEMPYGGGVMFLEVTNGGANALDVFTIKVKAHPASDYETYLSSYTEDPQTVPFVSTNPAALAASGTALLVVKLWSAVAVQITAEAATGGANGVIARGSITSPSPS